MPRDDPFSGIHLSEQANPGKLDQRLFTSQPKPSPPADPVVPKEAVKPVSSNSTAPTRPQIEPAKITSGPKLNQAFDLDDLPLYKASYLFTLRELETLEDIKLELGRELDGKVTKNDLIRAALHMLFEDYKNGGLKSYASRVVRRRGNKVTGR